MQRKFPKDIKRIVIKIGSSVIATYQWFDAARCRTGHGESIGPCSPSRASEHSERVEGMQPKIAHLKSLVDQIASAQEKGAEVVVVSSGAIVLGMGHMRSGL